jgi:hypothetical protein
MTTHGLTGRPAVRTLKHLPTSGHESLVLAVPAPYAHRLSSYGWPADRYYFAY